MEYQKFIITRRDRQIHYLDIESGERYHHEISVRLGIPFDGVLCGGCCDLDKLVFWPHCLAYEPFKNPALVEALRFKPKILSVREAEILMKESKSPVV